MFVVVSPYAFAQERIIYEKGTVLDAGKCKIVTNGKVMMLEGTRLDWDGPCVNGLADGTGIDRVYNPDGMLSSISRKVRAKGVIIPEGALASYFRRLDGTLVKTVPDPDKKGYVKRQEDFPPSQVERWAREIIENKPGQPIKAGENPPPGKGVPTPGTQPGSESSAGTATTGATSAGNNNDMNSGTRRDGAMTYPVGVYFYRATFQGRFMGFEVAQAGSESEALSILRSGSSYQFSYDGGCPAGSKVAGPYWGKANFRSASGGGIGHAWACGLASEVDAGNAVIDYCKRTSCATSEQYMTLAIGNVLKQPQPLDQYLCADGNPGTQFGSLGSRTGRGARSRRDPSANNSIQQFQGEDEPCISFVQRWMR
jgi:hypothetical protein